MGRTCVKDFVDRNSNSFEVNTLSIDPGIAGSGIAVWRAGEKFPFLNFPLRKKTRADYRNEFASIVSMYDIKFVLIEKPGFQASEKGQMVLRKGDLVELCLFVGGMEMALLELGCFVELVEVSAWKGQLPKDVVNRRIQNVYPEVNAKSHDWDAIGIGFWALGLINQ